MRMTHTYVNLELSRAAYEEIKTKLIATGYEDTFIKADGEVRIPMQGIAVVSEKKQGPREDLVAPEFIYLSEGWDKDKVK